MSNLRYKYSPVLEKPVEAEFGGVTDIIIPKETEVRVVANRNSECQYYFSGIGHCRDKMLNLAGDEKSEFHKFGFLPCKRLVDAHYRCLTEEKYGYSLEDAPEESKVKANDFINCAFKDLAPMSQCRRYFDEVLRTVIRLPDTKLSDT